MIFLMASHKQESILYPPPQLISEGQERKDCRLRKALYGLNMPGSVG